MYISFTYIHVFTCTYYLFVRVFHASTVHLSEDNIHVHVVCTINIMQMYIYIKVEEIV